MKGFTSLLSPQEARERFLGALGISPGDAKAVPLEGALGRVLAQDLVASIDLPPFDRSAVDGWAVRSEDLLAAAEESPVELAAAGEVAMGKVPSAHVGPGSAVRIATGAMLPLGADAVVMQELVDARQGAILVGHPARPGEHVVRRGLDVQAGEVILRRGRRLRAADLGILAGQGVTEVRVTIRPRVAILATGDELAAPSQPLIEAGQVRDMNSAALAGAVAEAGGAPVLCGIVRDDLPSVEEALRKAVASHEIVLISGGSSVGEKDVVAQAIASLGPPGVVVHGIAVRPGKPTVLAVAGSTPVIGLPGNPVSALVIFDLFARPVIDAMLGLDPDSRPWGLVRARMAEAVGSIRVREDHRRVRIELRPDGLWAVPLPEGSQLLTSLALAHGIVVVPPGGSGIAEGEEITVRLIG